MYLYMEKSTLEPFASMSSSSETMEDEYWGNSFRDEARRSGPMVYTNLLVNKPAETTGPEMELHTPVGDFNVTRSQFLPRMG